MLNPGMNDKASAQEILGNLAKVNDRHRRFSVTAADTTLYGLSATELESLKSMGLASTGPGRDESFDPDDLYNLSLHLRRPSLHKLAMRSWAAAFRESERERHLDLVYSLSEKPLPTGPVQVLTRAGNLLSVPVPETGDLYRETLVISGRHFLLPSPFRELVEEISADMQFYMLHDAVRWDVEFMGMHKLAECGGFSKLLVAQAHRRGLPARQVFGLLLSAPYATGHYWAEFRVRDEWIAVDPLMIRLLSQHAGLPQNAWPLYRSPMGALLRLSSVDAYDRDGAPCLSCFKHQYFRQLPVATACTAQYQVSYRVAVQLPV